MLAQVYVCIPIVELWYWIILSNLSVYLTYSPFQFKQYFGIILGFPPSNSIVIHITDLIFILFLIFCTRYTHVSLMLCKWFELINIYVVVVVVVVWWLYIYLYWCELWPMTSSRYFIVIHGSVSMSNIANNNNISIDADQFKHIDIKVIIVPFSKTL